MKKRKRKRKRKKRKRKTEKRKQTLLAKHGLTDTQSTNDVGLFLRASVEEEVKKTHHLVLQEGEDQSTPALLLHDQLALLDLEEESGLLKNNDS